MTTRFSSRNDTLSRTGFARRQHPPGVGETLKAGWVFLLDTLRLYGEARAQVSHAVRHAKIAGRPARDRRIHATFSAVDRRVTTGENKFTGGPANR